MEDVIVEMEAEMSTSRPPPNVNPKENSQSLWLKALKCGSVYDNSMLKGTFTEGLHVWTRYSMRAYWGMHETAILQ